MTTVADLEVGQTFTRPGDSTERLVTRIEPEVFLGGPGRTVFFGTDGFSFLLPLDSPVEIVEVA